MLIDQPSNSFAQWISYLMYLRLTLKIISLTGWLTSLMCMGKFKLPMISSDNTNPVWRRLKVFSLSFQTVTKATDACVVIQTSSVVTDAENTKQQEVWYQQSVFIEDNIFIHILFTILKNKKRKDGILIKSLTEKQQGRTWGGPHW